MKAKPISMSVTEDIEELMKQRMAEQRINSRSEYLRKCVREEAERARETAARLLMPHQLQAA